MAQADDGSLRVLVVGDPAVRAAINSFEGSQVGVLYESDNVGPYR